MQLVVDDDRDDLALMRDYQSGEKAAMAQLLRRRQAWLYTIARRTISDPELAKDGLQVGMTQIWRGARGFRGDSQVSSWMYQVMVRACIDLLRKEKTRMHLPMPELAETLISEPVKFENQVVDRLLVHGALAELDQIHNEVLTLLYLEELSQEEIAAKLKIPVGTVKSRIARGQSRLREVLRKLMEEMGNPEVVQYVKESEVQHAQRHK